MTATPATPQIAEEDRLRADLYNFLGVLLSGPPDEMLLSQTAGLSGDEGELGQADTQPHGSWQVATPPGSVRPVHGLGHAHAVRPLGPGRRPVRKRTGLWREKALRYTRRTSVLRRFGNIRVTISTGRTERPAPPRYRLTRSG